MKTISIGSVFFHATTPFLPRNYTSTSTQLHRFFHATTPNFHATTPFLPRNYTGLSTARSPSKEFFARRDTGDSGCGEHPSPGGLFSSTQLHHKHPWHIARSGLLRSQSFPH